MNPSLYRRRESWYGTYYELAVELQPTGGDEKLLRAIRRLWHHPALEGPWRSREEYGESFEITAGVIQPDPVPLYGALKLPDGREIGCVSHIIREGGGSDWLDLSLPTGMLEHVFPVQYPLDPATNAWLKMLDQTFVEMAEWIYEQTAFELAIIGEEASGYVAAADLTNDELSGGGFVVPGRLWRRLNPTVEGLALSSGLRFVPPTGPGVTWGTPNE